MANIGQLTVELSANVARFQNDMERVRSLSDRAFSKLESDAKLATTAMRALGATLSVGAFTAFIKSGIDAADELGKLSQKVGVTVESLSALQYAAQLSDVSTEELSTGLARLARAASDAAAGSKESAEAFAAIGVAVTDSSGQLRATEDLLLDIADKFSEMEDGAGKTALAMRIFGRAGAELIPYLNQGRAGFEELRKKAERLGIVISGETARAAEQFNDNLTRLRSRLDGLKFALAENVLPWLTRMSEELLKGRELAGGFASALALFGTINPFRDVVGNIRATREEIESLERARARYIKSNADTSAIDQALESEKKRLEFLKFQQRQAIQTGDPSTFDARDLRSRQRAPAPQLPDSSTSGGGADQGKAFLESLSKRLVALEENEFAVLRLEAAQKKVAAAAEPLIQQLERETEFRRELKEAQDRDAQEKAAELSRRQGLVQGVAEYVKGLEVEAKLLRLSNEERLIQTQLLKLEEAGIQRNSAEFQAATNRIRAAVDRMAGAQLFEETRQPLELLNRELARLQALLDSGAIDWDTYARAVFKAEDQFNKTTDEIKKTGKSIGEELGLIFSSAAEEAFVKWEGLGKLLKGIEQDLLRLGTRKLFTEPLLEQFKGLVGGGSSGSSNFVGPLQPGGGLSDLLGKGLKFIKDLIPFATGGSFTVGGSGGTDSQLVAFRATPGEEVEVRRPGQKTDGGGVSVVNHFTIAGPVDKRTQGQIASSVYDGMRRWQLRNG